MSAVHMQGNLFPTWRVISICKCSPLHLKLQIKYIPASKEYTKMLGYLRRLATQLLTMSLRTYTPQSSFHRLFGIQLSVSLRALRILWPYGNAIALRTNNGRLFSPSRRALLLPFLTAT